MGIRAGQNINRDDSEEDKELSHANNIRFMREKGIAGYGENQRKNEEAI